MSDGLQPGDTVVPRAADGLRLVTLDEFVVRPDMSWHVHNLVPAGSIVLVFGPPKCGKTFIVCDLAMHVAHGMPWRRLHVPRPLRVAFLAGEGRNGLRVRLKAWIDEQGTELKGDFRLLPQSIDLPERIGELLDHLRAYAPDLLIIDTLNAYFGVGDENSTHDMTEFVSAIRTVIDQFGCSVIIIHHTGVAEQARARGSTVLRAAADVVVQVGKDEASELTAFQVIEARDIEGWAAPIALKLRRVEIDWLDDEGAPLITCVVESANATVMLPGRGGRWLTAPQQLTADAVAELAAAKANGESTVLLLVADVISAARARGVVRGTAYRHLRQLASRMGWSLVAPSSIRVRV